MSYQNEAIRMMANECKLFKYAEDVLNDTGDITEMNIEDDDLKITIIRKKKK